MEETAIDPRPAWALPPERLGLAEGLAFSRDGSLLAVAHAGDQRVTVWAREPGGDGHGERPACEITAAEDGVDYPHDLDFSPDGRRLVVANRQGKSIVAFERAGGPGVRFSQRPVWRLWGRRARVGYCDGVAHVPPDGACLASVDLRHDRVLFRRRGLLRRDRFRRRPAFVLEGAAQGVVRPDGLAFSPDGRLLAVANHSGGTVTVYARGTAAPRYGPLPAATLGGGSLRCPHSLAFSPGGALLALTEAGGRAVLVWRRDPADATGRSWSQEPVLSLEACDVVSFEERNRREPKEGGPKGIAISGERLAVCSPQIGLRIHRLVPVRAAAFAEARP